ncbi:alkyl hydroperoxide reductase/ Thiol specific antioxidant/ Mal allergen, partial [mine drainage metagenome]
MLAAGETAPDFTLNSQDGTPITLSQFRGRTVVLYFYPKANSLGCTIETREFQQTLPEFASHDTAVLGISVDEVGAQQRFSERCAVKFP